MGDKPVVFGPDDSWGYLSPSAAHSVIRKSLYIGTLEFHKHLGTRMRDRDFTSVEMERVLRFGVITDAPEHDVRFNCWRYKPNAMIDGFTLNIVVALDLSEDLDAAPLVVVVTGFWSGKGTENGKKQAGGNRAHRGKAGDPKRSV